MAQFNSELCKIIGKRIKKLRENKGWSQDVLAQETSKEAQISRSSIANIEMGNHQAPLHVLYAIFRVLGSSIHIELPTYEDVLAELKNNSPDIGEKVSKKLPPNADETIKESILQWIKNPKSEEDDNKLH